MEPMDGKKATQDVCEVGKLIEGVMQKVKDGMVEIDKTSSFPSSSDGNKLQPQLAEWFGFFKGYDSMFSWWVAAP